MRHLFYIFIIVLALASLVAGQDKPPAHFIKITHSADETIAIDSTGKEWRFDKDKGDFVPATGRKTSGAGTGAASDREDTGRGSIILDPEVRCTDVRVGDIFEVFQEVVVGLDQRIEGNITCGRDVVVKGLVTGNIYSGRTVTVESTGEVRGDVIANEIRKETGGRILGQRTEAPFPGRIGFDIPQLTGPIPGPAGIVLAGFMIFICVITIALAPRHVSRVVAKMEAGPVRSFFWGILGWFSIIPLFALLIITIIGIPVAILILPLALAAGLILAFASAMIFIGGKFAATFGWQDKSAYLKSIIGVLVFALVQLVATLFNVAGVQAMGGILAAIVIVVGIGLLSIGFGAVISSRFGVRPKVVKVVIDVAPHSGAYGEAPPIPPVKPPPPPRSDASLSRPASSYPPPPVPPPLDSGRATERGEDSSNT